VRQRSISADSLFGYFCGDKSKGLPAAKSGYTPGPVTRFQDLHLPQYFGIFTIQPDSLFIREPGCLVKEKQGQKSPSFNLII